MSTRILAFIASMLMAACASGPPEPVAIEPADMCAFCKMAISQKQFCAELLDAERNVFKFDDIGCMLRFAREHGMGKDKLGQIYIFVADYSTRDWIKGSQAVYVQSESIPTPMASGLIAAENPKEANGYAAQFHGRVKKLEDIWPE